MPVEILIGTHNRHKTAEISKLLEGLPVKIRDLTEFPGIDPVEEDGETLLENAVLKAKYYAQRTGLTAMADDTGLEVDSLNGEPGVRSARYAGETCSYDDNNRKLLERLSGKKNGNRRAVFKCVIAVFDPRTETLMTEEGAIEGEILDAPRGTHGFGYDPIFYMANLKKTLAELSLDEKNRISHRALAVLKMRDTIAKTLKELKTTR